MGPADKRTGLESPVGDGDNGHTGKSRRHREVPGTIPSPREQDSARQTDAAVHKAVGPVLSHLRNLEKILTIQGRQVGVLMRHTGITVENAEDGDKGAGLVADTTWPCRKCGARLGYYDNNTDVMRMFKGAHCSYAHVGPGGWLKVVCPGCREENVCPYERSYDPLTQQVTVVGNELTLDTDELAQLYQQAQADPNGVIILAVHRVEPTQADEVG